MRRRSVVHLNGIIESSIYSDDMERAKRFYEDVMGLEPIFSDRRLTAYNVTGRNVLLVFQRGGSIKASTMPGGTIPGHDGAGPLHFAFAIDADRLPFWEERLSAHGIAIEGRMDWPRGGKSIYFRDPDGHLVELATPGLWRMY
jgi:catechol 2,3-dioxygenase-like lactoylglutathione lyase family enzyme